MSETSENRNVQGQKQETDVTATNANNYADVWVDHLGCVHERDSSQPARTLCGLNAGVSNRVLSPRACRACIEAHLAVTDAPVFVEAES